MKAFARRIINRTWIAACSREQVRFRNALTQVEATQRHYLLKLLRFNARTQFGRQHHFSQLASIAEYQRQVPLNPYETLTPYIEAIARGEPNVLTADPVRLFQPTSGSTAGTKLIPWTAAVAAEFRCGINPWLASLYQKRPGLLDGTAYWSISPPATPLRTHGRLRVGFEHDAKYLGFFGRTLFPLVSVVPPKVGQCLDITEFRTRTLLALLADESLGLISVWSPSFLTTLLEDFTARRDELIDLLAGQGKPAGKQRACFIRSLTRAAQGPIRFDQIWPKLRVISCWTHGSSAIYAENLRRYFPGIEMQGKGLVATEALVSLPFQESADPVLAVTAHFFEFQASDTKEISLGHQLAIGKEYQVIVTTGGGLYRYPLGDRVRVTGFIHGAPCFRFVGKAGLVSDHFGEKLDAEFVEKIICRAISQQNIEARFLLLAPVADERLGTGYTLFIQAEFISDPTGLERILEQGLSENFHYSHCRNVGQLSPVRVFRIDPHSKSAETVFIAEMHSRGIKCGDAKPPLLDRQLGWEHRFAGRFNQSA